MLDPKNKTPKKAKTKSLDELVDNHVGKRGTIKRDLFEEELRLDLIGFKIKEIRQKKNLTQHQLADLVGVKQSQIAKMEESFTNARFETILKVFRALGTKLNISIEHVD